MNQTANKPAETAQVPTRVKNPARMYRIRMLVLVVILLVLIMVSLCLGRYWASPSEVMAAFYNTLAQWLHFLPEMPIADEQAEIAVSHVRLPRVLIAVMVGAALSVAGAAYQGMFQNPMASQDVLGASSGAAFGAALAILLGAGAFLVSTSSFVFGLVAVIISYVISKISKSSPILSLVLAGMVISALFSSGTSFIKLVADTEDALPAITYWLMGSLASVGLNDILPVLILVVLGIVPLYLLRWRLNLLATSEEEARSMGLNATRLRLGVIACATFLTSTCVSISGLIGWVGLVIPHFCRLFIGNDYRRVIPACIVFGAMFLLLVDDFSRLVATQEIPIGILTSFVGAPVFIWLIAKGGGRNAS